MLTHLVAAALAATALAVPAAAPGAEAPGHEPKRHVLPQKTHFDLQAHRGGLGLTTESVPEAFAKAMELGVTTLELDTQVTEDGAVVVTHDRQISAQKCRDTGPAFPGDPEYPYVGGYLTNLTLEQVQTVECGYQQLPGHPGQEVVTGPMVELKDVFALVEAYDARQLTLNIETKVEAGAPEQTAPRELFVRRVHEEIAAAGMEQQVTIQSFDWGALMEMHEIAPDLPLVALTNHDFLEVGEPGASPWLGGIDADDFGGDLVEAAASIDGVVAVSPVYGFPQNGTVGQEGFEFYVSADMVERANAKGLEVIPWTVDDRATMEALLGMGVNGLITDYPDVLRDLMADRGMRLPKPYTED
ncbi:glycerophosphodiester phosphodiesterase family protein [Ornithinimicrobium cavernae]|uniref:glycerophosphodiester phosphodiesterase family protein n=1 Tax=Ornithinimicrobium cavernae TaxID=2666047 RepID=UPI000D695518|nr:glycerophosphodiester phosphodiesterase family protein [Ornithinimicrobium cavernae]